MSAGRAPTSQRWTERRLKSYNSVMAWNSPTIRLLCSLRVVVLWGACWLSAVPVIAQAPERAAGSGGSLEPAVDADLERRIGTLIQQLGNREFVTREQATSRLIEIGLPALVPLRNNAQHVDREIRYRCERILEIVLESDRVRRLEALSSGRISPDELQLPGWGRFRKRFDDSEESRQLYAQMLDQEWVFLAAMFGADDEASQVGPRREGGSRLVVTGLGMGELLEERLQYLARVVRRDVTRGSIAAMLFAAIEAVDRHDGADAANVAVSMNAASISYLQSMCYAPTIANAMKDETGVLRRMVGQWVLQPASAGGGYQNLTIAIRYQLKEGLVVAERVLAQEGLSPYIKSQAIRSFAEIGDTSHRAYLEKLLDDTTTVAVANVNPKQALKTQTQIRDVALAAILFHQGQDLKEFGFPYARRSGSFYQTNSLGFASDEEREQVFRRWAEFRNRGEKGW